MKLVIEADILIDAFSKQSMDAHGLMRGLAENRYNLLLSAPLLYAYEQAFYDCRHKTGLKLREIETVLSFICAHSEYVPCHKLWRSVMNKPEKDLAVACAYIGRADHLVIKRPDLYEEAREKLNLSVIDATKALDIVYDLTLKKAA